MMSHKLVLSGFFRVNLKRWCPLSSKGCRNHLNRHRCYTTTSSSFKNDHSKTNQWSGPSLIVKSDVEDLQLPHLDVCSAFFPKFEKWAEKDALECAVSGRKLTYAQLLNASLRWSAKVQEIKKNSTSNEVQDEHRISILAPNVLEYAPVLFGTLAAGFALNTINTNYKIGEISRQLKEVQPMILVVESTYEEIAIQAIRESKLITKVVTIGPSSMGNSDVKQIIYDENATKGTVQKVNSSSDGLILYSGGTTGLPKGVCISHRAMTDNLLAFTHPAFYPHGNTPDRMHQSVLGLLPFYHSYGMFVIMLTNLYIGAKVVVCDKFDPDTFGPILLKTKIRCLNLVPTLLNFVINSPLVTHEHLSSVRGVLIAAAPVLPSSAAAFIQKCDRNILFQEGFGMTETLANAVTPLDSVKIGYCGKLVANTEAKIVDPETNVPLGPEERGELILRGPGLMTKYLNNPTATAESIDDQGWFRTGDIATYSTDKYFKIVDRIKELIKVKGFQVSPAEVEDVLMEHPAVAEAAVIGIPCDRYGERVRAYVTLKGKVGEDELKRLVEEKLAVYKQLSGGVKFVDDLPKSQAGKILRRELKKLSEKE